MCDLNINLRKKFLNYLKERERERQ